MKELSTTTFILLWKSEPKQVVKKQTEKIMVENYVFARFRLFKR